MLLKILGSSRFLIAIAVLGAYLAAATIIIYGGFFLAHIIIKAIAHPDLSPGAGRYLELECIEMIDIFLLGTAFYITAIGLYELFIDRSIASDSWLHVENLDDLKDKLLGVIIVVLSVTFLEQIINWDGKTNILSLGLADALIIGVITLTISSHALKTRKTGHEQDTHT